MNLSVCSHIDKSAKTARQDDSTQYIKRLITQGYKFGIWNTHESHEIYDICDELNGNVFELEALVTDLKYNAPIFETSHVNCLCHLICYGDDSLPWIVVDWKGMSETGRYLDRSDKKQRSKDFYRLYDTYREKYQEIETNKYLTGTQSSPETGIYSFDVTMYDTEYTVNQEQKLNDSILDIILTKAQQYGIKVDEARLIANDYVVSTDAMLSIYDFSKEDLMDVNWSLEERRKDLQGIIVDLDKLSDWLVYTQDAINQLLIQYESGLQVQSSRKYMNDEVEEGWWISPDNEYYKLKDNESHFGVAFKILNPNFKGTEDDLAKILTEAPDGYTYSSDDLYGAMVDKGWIRVSKHNGEIGIEGDEDDVNCIKRIERFLIDNLEVLKNSTHCGIFFLSKAIRFTYQDFVDNNFNLQKTINQVNRITASIEKQAINETPELIEAYNKYQAANEKINSLGDNEYEYMSKFERAKYHRAITRTFNKLRKLFYELNPASENSMEQELINYIYKKQGITASRQDQGFGKAWWVEPNGTIHEVTGHHGEWAKKTQNKHQMKLLNEGWIRVGDADYKEFYVQVDNKYLVEYLDRIKEIILALNKTGQSVILATYGKTYEFTIDELYDEPLGTILKRSFKGITVDVEEETLEYSEPIYIYFKFKLPNKVAGYLKITRQEPGEDFYIKSIDVLEKYHRSGIATYMYNYASNYVKQYKVELLHDNALTWQGELWKNSLPEDQQKSVKTLEQQYEEYALNKLKNSVKKLSMPWHGKKGEGELDPNIPEQFPYFYLAERYEYATYYARGGKVYYFDESNLGNILDLREYGTQDLSAKELSKILRENGVYAMQPDLERIYSMGAEFWQWLRNDRKGYIKKCAQGKYDGIRFIESSGREPQTESVWAIFDIKKLLSTQNPVERELVALKQLASKQVGLLYHFTSEENLEKILETNTLNGGYSNGKEYISFTRNPNLNPEGRGFGGNEVRITIDGDKLSNNYKIEPHAHEAQFMKDNPDADIFNRNRLDEMEERVPGKIENIKDYIVNIKTSGKQVGTLYHFTNLKAAVGIIQSNQLNCKAAEGITINFKGVSLTRDKNFANQERIINGLGVCFVIDGDKLSNNYKIRPYDDFAKQTNKTFFTDEAEELVDRDILDIKKYIIKVILDPSAEIRDRRWKYYPVADTTEQLKQLCKENNIPLEIKKRAIKTDQEILDKLAELSKPEDFTVTVVDSYKEPFERSYWIKLRINDKEYWYDFEYEHVWDFFYKKWTYKKDGKTYWRNKGDMLQDLKLYVK